MGWVFQTGFSLVHPTLAARNCWGGGPMYKEYLSLVTWQTFISPCHDVLKSCQLLFSRVFFLFLKADLTFVLLAPITIVENSVEVTFWETMLGDALRNTIQLQIEKLHMWALYFLKTRTHTPKNHHTEKCWQLHPDTIFLKTRTQLHGELSVICRNEKQCYSDQISYKKLPKLSTIN